MQRNEETNILSLQETRNESELEEQEASVLESETERKRKEMENVRPFKLMHFNNPSIIYPSTIVLR